MSHLIKPINKESRKQQQRQQIGQQSLLSQASHSEKVKSQMSSKGNRGRMKNSKVQRKKSFTEALKEKYCFSDLELSNLVIDIVILGLPKSNSDDAELAFLRNVVLDSCRVTHAGLPRAGLLSLCPNVVDLDLTNNLLDSWSEILPIITQLPCLKFVNLTKNNLKNTQKCMQNWSGSLGNIENLVLNRTNMTWQDVLSVCQHTPQLKELHVCGNGYEEIIETGLEALRTVECLRLNENNIKSWHEIEKLHVLDNLHQLILSENPLKDIYYGDNTSPSNCFCSANAPDCDSRSHDQQEPAMDPSPWQHDMISGVNDSYVTPVCILDDILKNTFETETCTNCNEQSVIRDENHKLDNRIHEYCDSVCSCIIDDLLSGIYDENQVQCSSDNTDDNANGPLDLDRSNIHCSNESVGDINDNTNVSPSFSQDKCNDDSIDSGICTCDCDMVRDHMVASSRQKNTFSKLQTLCMSNTKVCDWKHLMSINEFPCLASVRIMDIDLATELPQKDRRKLYIACLPRIKTLNGSEISSTERDKAERYFVRYFAHKTEQPDIYDGLEKKHGKLCQLAEINLTHQEYGQLTFIYEGKAIHSANIRVWEPVGTLRKYINRQFSKKLGASGFCMWHQACGPHHGADVSSELVELFLDSLPMSRFDVRDGDHIHIEELR